MRPMGRRGGGTGSGRCTSCSVCILVSLALREPCGEHQRACVRYRCYNAVDNFGGIMDWLATLGMAMGSAWLSGINLYATVVTLGLLERFKLVHLPGDLG